MESYAQTYPMVVAQATPDERALFIRRTYAHLAGAVGAKSDDMAFVAGEQEAGEVGRGIAYRAGDDVEGPLLSSAPELPET